MLSQKIHFLPHPPELLSVYVAREGAKDIQKTQVSYDATIQSILEETPSTIVIIQSHGGIHPSGLSFHVPEGQQYVADFSPYGLDENSQAVVFDQSLAHFLQKSLHEYGRQSHIINEKALSLPALLFADQYLQKDLILPRIIVIGVSLEGAQAHYEYGSLLARALRADKDPISVLLTGQLSHCLTKESVAGYVPIAKNFDLSIQTYLEEGDWDRFMHMDPFEIQEVGEDAYRPLCVGLGILDALQEKVKWQTSCYEAPHGIGYLSGGFSVS